MNDPHTQDLTLLAYFMAHAPAEPQEWFKPDLPPAPRMPLSLDGVYLPPAAKEEFECWTGDSLDTEDIQHATVRAYCEARDAHYDATQAYQSMARRETLLQWPRAWARTQCRLHNEALLAMKQEA